MNTLDSSLHQTGWIKTYTGKMIQPLALVPDDIDIRDIAHALSRICRFAGHCHGVMNATAQEKLTALLHDASEAYLGDIPRPLKRHPSFAFYRKIEAEAEATIAEKFGLIYPMLPMVKQADDDALREEMESTRYEPFDESHGLSESEFLFWFNKLNGSDA